MTKLSEEEYFEQQLYRYDMKPHEDMNVLTYIEYEDTERYDEMTGSHEGVDYRIERNGIDMSLYALVSTALTCEDIDLQKLQNALMDLERENNISATIVPLDEVHIFLKYRPFDDGNEVSLAQQSYNAIVLFDEVEYETLSRILKDVLDVADLVNKVFQASAEC